MTKIREYLAEAYPDNTFMFADGFDEAIIGVDYAEFRIVYSIPLILEVLIGTTNMTMDEAIEFFSYNIGGAYVGKQTPIYVQTDWEYILG